MRVLRSLHQWFTGQTDKPSVMDPARWKLLDLKESRLYPLTAETDRLLYQTSWARGKVQTLQEELDKLLLAQKTEKEEHKEAIQKLIRAIEKLERSLVAKDTAIKELKRTSKGLEEANK